MQPRREVSIENFYSFGYSAVGVRRVVQGRSFERSWSVVTDLFGRRSDLWNPLRNNLERQMRN
jgi:hypothetical protein